MSEKQLTPMKRLQFNLGLLKSQLERNFRITELVERTGTSYQNAIESDYILIFTNLDFPERNFALSFNYKGVDESQFIIEITIKNKDCSVTSIKKFSFSKFKEILNGMVKLNFTDSAIVDYILLLKNVEDTVADSIVKADVLTIMDEEFNAFFDKHTPTEIQALCDKRLQIDIEVNLAYHASDEYKKVIELQAELNNARKIASKKLIDLTAKDKKSMAKMSSDISTYKRVVSSFIRNLNSNYKTKVHKTNFHELNKKVSGYIKSTTVTESNLKYHW